jgi:DNA mismatch repair protein MutL
VGQIEILSTRVVDQIAAGEVVERPASVVKELVENALDAGATAIHVELEDGGRTVVQVSDDGRGMDRDDAVLSIDRHATSKIRTAPDLVGVATYGFRGEALASIASVSQFELETASAGNGSASGVGTRLLVRGGRLETVEEVARTPGTTVTVRKLFGNTPARRKFLRSAQAETRAAVQALTVLALARLDVAFTLASQGRSLLDAPRVASVADRIAALFGRGVADQLVPVEYSSGVISVRGFVQRPADARPSGRKAFLFVNGRPFRDPFLIRAAEGGYRGAITPGSRPTLFLSIGVPGDRVDVNVHPAKLEVRFRDKRAVEEAAETAVREGLASLAAAGAIRVAESFVAEPGGRESYRGEAAPWRAGPPEGGGDAALVAASLFDAAEADGEPGLDRSRTLLQVFNTYVVFQADDELVVVDQHSAHERVLYEQAMAELKGEGGAAQRLLLPLTLDLVPEELEAVETYGELLMCIGFEVEPFGGRSVVLHAVPNPHPRFDARHCFEELVADLARGRLGGLANRLERFAATYGCRAAVKAGQRLDPEEMRGLIRLLFACELPPHDVHGRPAIVRIPRHELERRFGRT